MYSLLRVMRFPTSSSFRCRCFPAIRGGWLRKGLAAFLAVAAGALHAAETGESGTAAGVTDSLTSNGITWTFDREVPYGTFVTGDYWVVGPLELIGISNTLNSPDFEPRPGQNGSMLNPLVGHERSQQGYDDGLNSYNAALNAGRPGGEPLSPENPLELAPHDTLVSMVSWLYRSAEDAEPGTPRFNGGTGAPRPVTRSAGILTVLPEPPPENAFRPPYAGNDNTVRYTLADLHLDRLLDLDPPAQDVPDAETLAGRMSRPWVDHVFEYLGAMIHPSEHMPNYGRDMGHIALQTALMVHLDFSRLPGSPDKLPLVANLVQYGIDCTGIADNGGGWRANGGHGLGRKWPILFAGLMLDDPHMQNVGTWGRHDGTSSGEGTEFQEFQNCFYVSQAEVEITNSEAWNPDKRDVEGGRATPYTEADIGTPEWGIRHSYRPQSDNAHLSAIYRDINAGVHPGFALAVRLMGAETLWNHPAFLDYCDRIMDLKGGGSGTNGLPDFAVAMWEHYRSRDADPPDYPAFLASYFSGEQLEDPRFTGENEDPDNDGRANLAEYLLRTNPAVPDAPHLRAAVEDGVFRIRMRRLGGITRLDLAWERAGHPASESWEAVSPTGMRLLEDANHTQLVEYQFAAPPDGNPGFFRILLSR